jgi:cytochrome P450
MATTDEGPDDREPPAEQDGNGVAGDDERPPGPDGLPLVGNTFQFLRDPVGFYERLGAEYDGDVVRYEIAGTSGYLLTHPDHVERVLVHDDDVFVKGQVSRDSLGQVVDGGVLLSEGEEWASQRKLLQPAFYRGRIETYADTMVDASRARVEGWSDGEVVPVRDEMQQLTLETLARTLFGVEMDGRGREVGEAARALLAKFDAGGVSAYLPPWVPTPANVRFRRAMSDLTDTVDALIAERKGDTEGASRASPARSDRGASRPACDDLISLLLSADDGLDDEAIRANMVTFLIAGHETTSLALTYALSLLADHPEKRDRLHAELDDVDGDPSAGDLPELDYLDDVVTEALRLYPPAYTMFREPTEPVEIGGYTVEPGENLSLPQYLVHRDERWYDDPLAFRPERWTDEFEEDLPDYAYFPFGGGPRHCIGMRFATMEAKLSLATVLSRVTVEPTDETEIDPRMAITLQPGGPVPLRVRTR